VYDTPKTPCQRLCEDPTVPEEVKQALRRQFATLKLGKLRREILQLQEKLLSLAHPTEEDPQDA
jgi:hypothetical protein